MRVIVACEFSGIVTDAFRLAGHEAWSCDLLDTEGEPSWHIKDDVLNHLGDGWDLMIAHPPCTALTVAGNRWYHDKPEIINASLDFVLSLANSNIPRICIENPVGRLSTLWRKPDQIIQPWEFGHDASKKTCLWLKNLPKLEPTMIIIKERYANQTPSGQNNLGPSKDRWKIRSRTYQGIADAMASQWG